MSHLIENKRDSVRKTALASAIIIGLGLSDFSQADQYTFSFSNPGGAGDTTSTFTMLNPDGSIVANSDSTLAYGLRTQVSGTMTWDTQTGSGSMSITPFSFFASGPASATTISIVSIGDGQGGAGTLILGNMGFNWNNNNGIPVSIAWDAQGMLNAISGGGLSTGSTITGGAVPASNNASFFAQNIPLGAAPLATTTFDTTDIGVITLGTNPSGTTPLIADTVVNTNVTTGSETGIGGSPMKAGPFGGNGANFDFTSLTVTNFVDTTPPVVTVTPNSINIDSGSTFDPLAPVDNNGNAVTISAVDAVDGTLTLATDCTTNAVPANPTADFSVIYDCTDLSGNSNSNNGSEGVLNVTVVSAGDASITLTGSATVIQEGALAYTDAGATCTDADGVTNIPVGPNFSIDTSGINTLLLSPPDQIAIWSCTGTSGNTVTKDRTVTVVDTIPPTITLTPSCAGGITKVADGIDPTPAATAIDPNFGTDLTAMVAKTGDTVNPSPVFGSSLSQTFNLSWNVSDLSGNNSVSACQIILGNPDPVATLLGNATEVVADGASFVDAGATCDDFTDGPLANASVTAVDSSNNPVALPFNASTPNGNYTLTYTCGPNSLTNTGTTTRLVIIGVAFSASSTSGSAFVMLDPGQNFVGGADDVFFSWDGSLYNDPVTQTTANMFMGSAQPQPFFGFPWDAHDIRAFGPGSYTIPTSRGNTLTLDVGPDQIGTHMLFDWNNNNDIDVVLTWDINGVFVGSIGSSTDLGAKGQGFSLAVVDPDGDGISGTPMADGPFAGFNANFNIQLTPQFALPDASATAAQGANNPITVVSTTGGIVTVTTAVNPDVNGVFTYGTTGFSYDWSASDVALLGAETGGPSTGTVFTFDPTGIAAGGYSAVVKAIDNTTGLTSTVTVPLQVTTGAADPDSDADGIPDSQDAIDNTTTANVQQGVSGDGVNFLLTSSTGVLNIGPTATAIGVTTGSYDAQVPAANLPADPTFTSHCDGECYSFTVSGIAPGSAVDVTIPLAAAIPNGGVVRKFINGAWRNFATTGGNVIMSAPGALGDCSTPGAFALGANPGDFCLMLTIVDGGPNDADGVANGIIVDPVGVSSGAIIVAPPSNVGSPSKGGGCSISGTSADPAKGGAWWLLTGLLGWMGWRRRRS